MFKEYTEKIKSITDLERIINYYYPNHLKKNKMNCPFHKETTPSFSISEKGGRAFYHCFGCGEGGDVIKFIEKIENISFIQALKKAYEILNLQLNLPKLKEKPNLTYNKEKTIEYYNKEAQKAIEEGDVEKALALSLKADEEKERIYPELSLHKNTKNKPLRIWENLDIILKANNITPVYNEITKNIEIEGLPSSSKNSFVVDIQSLCVKSGFNLTYQDIEKYINRIGENNKINPVGEYLRNCFIDFENEKKHIKTLCNAIITTEDFDQNLKEILITKWLLNTANIAFNEGETNIEGVLTLQGNQGIGKTRLIRKLIPMYLKTGLELDPSDKDKVYQNIKYWVVEVGELDCTLKRDVAKLKAFLTESKDEIRRPYAPVPEVYPRKTSFYATVNSREFLKDETGNRRYWVIPVKKIDFNLIDSIDINQLWGEVMYLREDTGIKPYLEKDEMKMLMESNEDFRIQMPLETLVDVEFNWEANKEEWAWKSSSEILRRLGNPPGKGLTTIFTKKGATFKKYKGNRGYLTPPYKYAL